MEGGDTAFLGVCAVRMGEVIVFNIVAVSSRVSVTGGDRAVNKSQTSNYNYVILH